MNSIKEINWRSDRSKANVGIFMFLFAIALFALTYGNMFGGLTSLGIMFLGWYVFSVNHQKITSYKLKAITDSYIQSVKESQQKKSDTVKKNSIKTRKKK